ncbi:MAG: hypothetical protein QM486_02375 [Flavobacteriaceae bacterium]
MQLTTKSSKILEQGILFLILALVFLYDAFVKYIGFLDEFTALLSTVVFLYYVSVKGKVKLFRNEHYIILFLGIIITIGLLSNFWAYHNGHKTDGIAIVGDLINFNKAFITYLAVRLLSDNFDAKKVLSKITKYSELVFYILALFVVFDFIFKFFPHQLRYGIPSFELFFQHPSRYGFAFAFIFLSLLPKYYKNNKSFLFLILILGMLSMRIKYFGFVFMGVLFLFYGKKLYKIPKIYLFAIIGCIGLIIMGVFRDQIQMYFSFNSIKTGWSRAVILYYSFTIGNDFFPLGTGFGTYASYYSGLHYSWVYDLYGLNNIWGMSRHYWGFLADQYWPMVLGQFGYFGLISMLLIIYNYFNLFIKQIKNNMNNVHYYYLLSALLGLLLLLIDSTSDAIFTQQRAVVMFMYFALIVNTTKDNNEK